MKKDRRGFASMSPEKQREIARKGGIAAHQKGTGHEWTSQEAREAGRKGGAAAGKNRRLIREAEARQTAASEPQGSASSL